MRRSFLVFSFCCLLAAALAAHAATGGLLKVLPELLDLQGRHARSPSLYERDAYQVYLHEHTNLVSTVRFYVQWKATGAAFESLKLRVEMRGTAKGDLPGSFTLETNVMTTHWYGRWTQLTLNGNDYQKLGELTAWRATLWDGTQLLGEQKSFLW